MTQRRIVDVLGYALQAPRGRRSPAYRFTRGNDVIDVMAADHVAPSRREKLHSSPMFAVDGGTQALQRTMICIVADTDGSLTRFSVITDHANELAGAPSNPFSDSSRPAST